MKKDRWIAKYCIGKGVEIGGADNCVEGINTIKVDNCQDYFGKEYTIDLSMDATDLHAFTDNQFDFLITNHVLEHIANPIKALLEWRRVVRHGGHLFTSIPKRSRTFDYYRPKTPLFHLLEDFRKDVGANDPTHIDEWNELGVPCVYRDWDSPLTPTDEVVYDIVRYYHGDMRLLEDEQVRVLKDALESEKRRFRQLAADRHPLDLHFHVWESCHDVEDMLRSLRLAPTKMIDDYRDNSILFVVRVDKLDPLFETNIGNLKRGEYPDWIERKDIGGAEPDYHNNPGRLPPMRKRPPNLSPLQRLATNLKTEGLTGTAAKVVDRVRRRFSAVT
jgi:SAM-dependent methyltransferase